jgi:hypothetical protein
MIDNRNGLTVPLIESYQHELSGDIEFSMPLGLHGVIVKKHLIHELHFDRQFIQVEPKGYGSIFNMYFNNKDNKLYCGKTEVDICMAIQNHESYELSECFDLETGKPTDFLNKLLEEKFNLI